MENHKVVSRDAWIEARKQLLAKEKEFTRLLDQLSQQRRDLPWERVDKEYVFEGPSGKETLSQLFRLWYAWSFDKGAREMARKVTCRCCRCTSIPSKLSAQNEQLLHPASQAGSNMKWQAWVRRHSACRRRRAWTSRLFSDWG
jgi:predicted dithiol-disulfide oxidoreductase (DUF899 family)